MRNRDDIIVDAFRKLGIPGDHDTLHDEQVTAGIRALISMTNTFHAKHGMPLWKTRTLTVPLTTLVSNVLTIGPSGNIVTTDIPSRILDVWKEEGGNRVPLVRYSRQEFYDIPHNTSFTEPSVYFIEESKSEQSIYMWPTPSESFKASSNLVVSYVSKFTRIIDDDSFPDFPDHWEEAIIYGLAVRLASEYSTPLDRKQSLQKEAKEYFDAAIDEDGDEASIYLRPAAYYGR
ncbi:hypothetical protein [uncultured Paraglaciecola sp.]|uniref:phage adaptor protein n=1 Tax=uncultured Paraglaciecola sp. TaxID=1765024 RepID=UPI0026317EC0|nr:hypothetical protein [uncultured Paraglaciecola sp.]